MREKVSAEAIEASSAYDARREAELSTNLWRFATGCPQSSKRAPSLQLAA